MSLIPFAPFLTADFLAAFFALLLESPAVCSAIRYGPMSSFVLGFGVCVRLLLSAFH